MPRNLETPIFWNAPYLSKALSRKGIHNRDKLAERLPGVSRATVYRSFDADWHGTATPRMIDQLRTHLGLSFQKMITQWEPVPSKSQR